MLPSPKVFYLLATFLSLVSAEITHYDESSDALNNTNGDQPQQIYVTEPNLTASIADASINALEGSPRIAAGPSYWNGVSLSTSLAASHISSNQGSGFDQSSTQSVNDTAYFSWNGATAIDKWIVLASNDTLSLSITANFWQEIPNKDFETSVQVAQAARYVRALAVNVYGDVLGSTPVLDMLAENTIDESFNLKLFTAQWKRMSAGKSGWSVAGNGLTEVREMLRDDTGSGRVVKLLCLIVGIVIGLCGLSMVAVGVCNLLRSILRRRKTKRSSNSRSNRTWGVYRAVETCDEEMQAISSQLKKFRFEVSVDEVEEDEGDELV